MLHMVVVITMNEISDNNIHISTMGITNSDNTHVPTLVTVCTQVVYSAKLTAGTHLLNNIITLQHKHKKNASVTPNSYLLDVSVV